MPDRETSQAIDDAAAIWAAKIDRAPLSSGDQQALDTWLASDTRNLGAFARARAISLHSERARALGSGFRPSRFETPHPPTAPTRRRLIWGASAIAASVAAVGLGVTYATRPEQFGTARGEVRLAPLADGSVVTMNTSSRIAVHYTEANRTVRLLEGEAFFDVAGNPARPFLVIAGDTVVRAVGTAFTVRRLPGRSVEIVVSEGKVEVTRRSQPGRPVSLTANARAVSLQNGAAAAATAPLAAGEVTRAMAWREGKIAFEGDTLQAAAEEFARYSDTRIVITDPVLGRKTITGLFTATDPAGFARAVAISLDARAEIRPGEVVLTR